MSIVFTPTWEVIDSYYDNKSLSQSSIKLIKDPAEFKKVVIDEDRKDSKKYYEEKDSYIFGSLLDDRLSELDLDERYLKIPSDKPGPAVMSVIHKAVDGIRADMENEAEIMGLEIGTEDLDLTLDNLERTFPGLEDTIAFSILEEQYQSNWKMPTKIESIKKHRAYWDFYANSNGKQLVDKETWDEFESSYSKVINSDFYQEYVQKAIDSSDYEVYFQLPIYFEAQGVNVKSLLDIVVKNKLTNEVFIIDTKTTIKRLSAYVHTAKSYGYVEQLAFYGLAVKSLSNFEGCAIRYFNMVYSRVDKAVLGFEYTRVAVQIALMGYQNVYEKNIRTRDPNSGEYVSLELWGKNYKGILGSLEECILRMAHEDFITPNLGLEDFECNRTLITINSNHLYT